MHNTRRHIAEHFGNKINVRSKKIALSNDFINFPDFFPVHREVDNKSGYPEFSFPEKKTLPGQSLPVSR